MRVQSLSISVPGTGCINNCKFCVSRMRSKDEYQSPLDSEALKKEYMSRLTFARESGCNTMMITGTLEPQQNMDFLRILSKMNESLDKPFQNIEIQTTGRDVDFGELRKLGIKTVSISVSCLDSNVIWKDILGINKPIYLEEICKKVLREGMNLRLSLNLENQLLSDGSKDPEKIFTRCKVLGANQVTLRKMYFGPSGSKQFDWLIKNSWRQEEIDRIDGYIYCNGRFLDILEYGQKRYSIHGMSVVLDDDCMATKVNMESVKYMILRENAKLYTKWDDPGSLIF